MVRFNFIVFLSTIAASYFFDYGSSLHVEGIRNGEHVEPGEFTYQAGILIPDTENYICPYKLIGSGIFVSKDLVLTAAQLFVHDNGIFIENTYSIAYSMRNWFRLGATVVLIEKIYFPGGGSYHFLNNIAVAKSTTSLVVEGNPKLSKVSVPSITQEYYIQPARVSGYGYHYIEIGWNKDNEMIREYGSSQHNLLYALVRVHQGDCKIGNRFIDHERHLCGKTEFRRGLDGAGVCNDDAGSPLVLDNLVLGVALLYNQFCDDSLDNGNGYMKVSYFAEFINSIINETPLASALIRYNLIPSAAAITA